MVNQITKMIKIMKIMRQAFLNGTFPSHPLAMCPTPVWFHYKSRDHKPHSTTTSGILTTWHKRVHTCLYHVRTVNVQCYRTSIDRHSTYHYWKTQTCTYMVQTYLEMYIHVCTWYVQKWKIINMYVHGMYMVCTMKATNMYVHCSDMYVHVCTFTYKVCIIQTCTYKVQTCIYRQCSVYRWLHTFHELYRQRCTVYIHRSTVYVHWYILSAAAFWFALLAGLLAGSGCCLVSHLFKFKHTSLIGISLRT